MLNAIFGHRAPSSSGAKGGRSPTSPTGISRTSSEGETLAAVILRQKRRKKACAERAAKAENRRDALLEEAKVCEDPETAAAHNDKARAAENVRKKMTAMVITLRAQIGVLDKVITEFGFKDTRGEEDPLIADERIATGEQHVREADEDIRVQREKAEQISRMLSQNIAMPMDEDDIQAVHDDLHEFQKSREGVLS